MAANKSTICAKWGAPLFGNDATVVLRQTAVDQFTVVYGLQVKKALTYSQACAEFGACVLHAAIRARRGVAHLDNHTVREARQSRDARINAESIV